MDKKLSDLQSTLSSVSKIERLSKLYASTTSLTFSLFTYLRSFAADYNTAVLNTFAILSANLINPNLTPAKDRETIDLTITFLGSHFKSIPYTQDHTSDPTTSHYLYYCIYYAIQYIPLLKQKYPAELYHRQLQDIVTENIKRLPGGGLRDELNSELSKALYELNESPSSPSVSPPPAA